MSRTRFLPSRDLLNFRFNLSKGEGNLAASGRASELLTAGVIGTLATLAGVYVGYMLGTGRRAELSRPNGR